MIRFLRPEFWSYFRLEYFPTVAEVEARKQSVKAWQIERCRREANACDICSGRSAYLCPTCRKPIDSHSHENDYHCERHGFVNPIRQSDGAVMNGDGSCSSPYVLAEGEVVA